VRPALHHAIQLKGHIMKAVLITLLVFAGTAALADDAAQELANRTPFRSVQSRQAVQEAYLAAQRDGTLPVTGEAASLDPVVVHGSEQERTQVRLQAREAAKSHIAHELM
jgi:hypothetical protein